MPLNDILIEILLHYYIHRLNGLNSHTHTHTHTHTHNHTHTLSQNHTHEHTHTHTSIDEQKPLHTDSYIIKLEHTFGATINHNDS